MLLLTAAAFITAVTARTSSCSSEESREQEKALKDVRDLRRQLMRDNSDYSHEIPKSKIIEIHKRADVHKQNITENDYVTTTNQHISKKYHYSVEHVIKKNGNKAKLEHPVLDKDLFYNIDDEKLIKKKPKEKKYKMVRHQFRRNDKNRYIQEEDKEGVTIASLKKAPFPELRLPHSRRQYQHDHNETTTEEEQVSPPPVEDIGADVTDDIAPATITQNIAQEYQEGVADVEKDITRSNTTSRKDFHDSELDLSF